LNTTLVDAGFFVALYNKREATHSLCVKTYEELETRLATCEACITEALHLLGHASAAVSAMLTSIENGSLEVPFHIGNESREIAHIMRKYTDTPCDFADACLIHLADQLSTGDILTLDSDFKHYRWRRTRKFSLLIPLD
jgi:uncharacterized protein